LNKLFWKQQASYAEYASYTLSPFHRNDMWVEKIMMMFIRSVGTAGAEDKLHWFRVAYAAVTNRQN